MPELMARPLFCAAVMRLGVRNFEARLGPMYGSLGIRGAAHAVSSPPEECCTHDRDLA